MDTLKLTDGEFGITLCQPVHDEEGWLDSFIVRIEEPGMSASARVHNSRYIQGPVTFFSEIAKHWRGWVGKKTWQSLESELELAASSDSLGHITIRVSLQPDAGPGNWQVTTYTYLEAGQLDSLLGRVTNFSGREP